MKCWQLSYNCKNSWKILQRCCGCKRRQNFRKEQLYRTAEGQIYATEPVFLSTGQETCRIPPGTPSDSAGLVNRDKCLLASWVSSVPQTPGGPAYTAPCQTENHWRHTCKRKHLCQQVRNAVLHNTSQKAWKEKFYLALVKSIWFLCIFPIKYRQSFLAASADSLNSSGWKKWFELPQTPCLCQAHLPWGLFDTLGNFATFWRTCKRNQKVAISTPTSTTILSADNGSR